MMRRPPNLNGLFRALADPTRRAIVERLAKGPAGTSALAEPFDMALPSFVQHMAILEAAGLVRSIKLGRIRMYRLVQPALGVAEKWLGTQRRHRREFVVQRVTPGRGRRGMLGAQ